MKTKLLLAAMLISCLTKAQITLENSYQSTSISNNMMMLNLANSGYKYYHLDYTNKIVRLYNMNHSIWKTIPLPTLPGHGLYTVSNISESLFDTDAAVEVAYTTIKFNFTVNPATINYEGRIINDNGSSVLTLADCALMSVYNAGPNGFKLIAQIDTVNKSSPRSFNVYSLIGSMPIITSNNDNGPVDMTSALYPNPSGERVRFDYSLPPGTTTGEVILFDLKGTELKRYNVDNSFNSLELNNSDLPSGTYFYTITAGTNSTTKKMVIVK
jgi:hypothetical protein